MMGRALSIVATAALVLGVTVLGAPGCGDAESPTTGSGAGQQGTGGAGGAGGVAPECAKPSDCVATHPECVGSVCNAGACGLAPLAAGTKLGDQPGDCKTPVCDGEGSRTEVAADDPPASDACVARSCASGAVVESPAMAGTTCPTGVCDGKGKCVECNTVANCPAPSDECSKATCEAHVCGVGFQDPGTLLSTQTSGDCKESVCDGHGKTVDQPDDTDLPNDGNDCTADTCSGGVVGHAALTGNACGAVGSGLTCDASGHCSGCTDASQCPGQGDPCKTPTCIGGSCDFDFVSQGTPGPTQVLGDCKKLECDGQGTLQPVVDTSDVPADDGNVCTGEGCVGGSPQHPPVSEGTICPGGVCNTAGACVQCNFPSDCPSSPTICKAPTCTAGACSFATANEGAVCNQASCMNGVANAADTCASGTCVDGGATTCAPYACGALSCVSSCGNDMGCATGISCDTGIGRCTNGPKCTDYCTEMATHCTATHEMYATSATCLAVCAAFPDDAAMGGNTLGCRLYHGGAPAQGDPITHCPHAGPAGEGVCGGECESFCSLAAGLCTGPNKQWNDVAACMTDCATFPTTVPYNDMVVSGDSFACRMYHLTAAATSPVTHCPHIAKVSAVCQ